MTVHGVRTVARQEFRLRIRAGRWRVLLAVFFAVLVGFTALLRSALTGLAQEEVPFRGTVLFGGLMLFVLALALLVVPALAAQSVNGDRERGTLAVLQVTRLSAGEIAVGKLLAAWGTSLVFLALTLPLVLYAMTQDGVPVTRVLGVLLVMALLLGTVCAVALCLSALLARTTTSAVLSYLSVFGLTVGTLIVFGLATATTSEQVTESYRVTCEGAPPDSGCTPTTETYQSSRVRTDRTWWLLSPNPFVVLADAAPALPDDDSDPLRPGVRARDLDPLGQVGSVVRDLRRPPLPAQGPSFEVVGPGPVQPAGAPVWPTGLAVNVLLGAGALLLTARRLRTPTRTLPRGTRVA